jgi:hypothetical protein
MEFINIYDYRKFTDYVPVIPENKFSGDILCLGTCDLNTIRPRHINYWTWAQRLSRDYSVDVLAHHASLDISHELLNEYLKIHTPGIVCFTVQIYGELVNIGTKYYTLHENSRRVLKFLQIKKVLSQEQYLELDAKVQQIQLKSADEKLEVNLRYFQKIVKLLEDRDIRYCWTYNATKTANDFYRHADVFSGRNYLGFVTNLDILPESSIGNQTQNKLYQTFLEGIRKHESSN